MPKYLLIAEKPDLMRQIEAAYTAHKSDIPYDVAFLSQRGHLVTLQQPDEMDESLKVWSWDTLPFHPESYGGWKYKVIKEEKKGNYMTSAERFAQIKRELRSGSYDAVINAGDPDQEGELLIRTVLAEAGNKLPIKRFWTNDLTEGAIVRALQNLRDDESDPMLVNLLAAAYGRQHSDYRFGMNLSRAATLKMNATVSCGRVETPILAIVCRREQEIRNFVPSTSYGVRADYSERFSGKYFEVSEAAKDENADEDAKSGVVYFKTKKEAEDLIASLPKKAVVKTVETKTVKESAPKLYKLATAQIAAGKIGYNDADTLAVIQGLYEKGLLSYPRTDCEYLASNENFRGILDAVKAVPSLATYVSGITDADIQTVRKSKKWVNDKALEDSGHSALRPTERTPDYSALSKEEKAIYELICRRFVAIFLPPLVQNKTLLVAEAGGKLFRSAGKTLVDPGFTVVFGSTLTDVNIPAKKIGDILDVDTYTVTEKTTKCPKRFTSPDLIDVCEHPLKYLEDASLKALGKQLTIGTPATRSAIIRKLIKYKYLAEKKEGKSVLVIPTEIGEKIIRNLGDCDICKVDLTGLWEEQLSEVRSGKRSLEQLEADMRTHVEKLVKDIHDTPMTPLSNRQRYLEIAACPSCGKKILAGEKGAFCSGWKAGCGIWMPRTKWGAEFTDQDYIELLSGKSVRKTIDLEDGANKEATIVYDQKRGGLVDADEPLEEVCECPVCGGKVFSSGSRFYCAGNGTGKSCTVAGYRRICGAYLETDDIRIILSGGTVEKTCSKDGRQWQQKLFYDKQEMRVAFVQPERKMSGYKCPCCRKYDMYVTDSMYRCSDKACGFTIWKTIAGHTLTETETTALVNEGKTGMIEDFVSKKQTTFSAMLSVNKKTKSIDFEQDRKTSSVKCPCCRKKDMYETDTMYRCSDKSCGFTVWKTIAGHMLTEEELSALSKDGKTGLIDDFVSKKQTKFSAMLAVNKKKKSIDFEFPKR